MIGHFVKRDFITNQLYWVLLLIFFFATLIFGHHIEFINFFIGQIYFFFGIFGIGSVLGTTMRTQLVLSRNYLLSLPLERNRMYMIVYLRSLIFMLPFIIWALIAPIYSEASGRMVSYFYPYWLYGPTVLAGVFWLIGFVFAFILAVERLSRYLTQRQRLTAWIVWGLSIGVELAIAGGLYQAVTTCLTGSKTPIWLSVLPSLGFVALAAFKYFQSRKRFIFST